MSFAAFKMMHLPTGIENCGSGFITHSSADFAPQIPPIPGDDLEPDWPTAQPVGPIPNLIVTASNVLEVYVVRVQEKGNSSSRGPMAAKRGGVLAGISGASLELVCHYRLHGNVETLAILPKGGADGGRKRDSIILTFEDAKISVLEFDDSINGLRTSSMHCFEGPDWLHLKRGRETFARGPLVKADLQGRYAGVLVYREQMILLKTASASEDYDEENAVSSSRVELSYVISLRDLGMNSNVKDFVRELGMSNVKDFTFINGYTEPVTVILYKLQTCMMISAFTINTTPKQHLMIWFDLRVLKL